MLKFDSKLNAAYRLYFTINYIFFRKKVRAKFFNFINSIINVSLFGVFLYVFNTFFRIILENYNPYNIIII